MSSERCTSFQKRLREAMLLRGVRQVQLCEQTGIPKSAMSQYVNGAFEPKQDRLWELARALSVNEAWLMGYEVPMERNSNDLDSGILDFENRRALEMAGERDQYIDTYALTKNYHRLNDEGKQKVLDYMDDLVGNQKYLKANGKEDK